MKRKNGHFFLSLIRYCLVHLYELHSMSHYYYCWNQCHHFAENRRSRGHICKYKNYIRNDMKFRFVISAITITTFNHIARYVWAPILQIKEGRLTDWVYQNFPVLGISHPCLQVISIFEYFVEVHIMFNFDPSAKATYHQIFQKR